MKFYISGKISGTSDYMDRFQKAEDLLKARGHEVINPAKTNATLPESTTWDEYMQVCFALLPMCDAIYMLDGFGSSAGACLELDAAKRAGLKIYYEANEGYFVQLVRSKARTNNGWEVLTEHLFFKDEETFNKFLAGETVCRGKNGDLILYEPDHVAVAATRQVNLKDLR